jgi:hypothetical protein
VASSAISISTIAESTRACDMGTESKSRHHVYSVNTVLVRTRNCRMQKAILTHYWTQGDRVPWTILP